MVRGEESIERMFRDSSEALRSALDRNAEARALLRELRLALDEGVFFLPPQGPGRKRGIKLLDRLTEAGFPPHKEE